MLGSMDCQPPDRQFARRRSGGLWWRGSAWCCPVSLSTLQAHLGILERHALIVCCSSRLLLEPNGLVEAECRGVFGLDLQQLTLQVHCVGDQFAPSSLAKVAPCAENPLAGAIRFFLYSVAKDDLEEQTGDEPIQARA